MKKQMFIKRPWCPFCGQEVALARDLPDRKMSEFTVGECSCGAVYSCDPTGHNVGAAVVETLVHACGDNWDLAWELIPEDDYLTGRIENYDEQTHQVVESRNLHGRSVRGVLYFVRLHKEVSEIAGRLKEKQEQKLKDANENGGFAPPPVEPQAPRDRARARADKVLVTRLVESGDEDALVGLCLDDKKTLRLIQRLLYDPEEEKRWRTAWLIGRVSARVATRDPGQVAELVHRLFEACSDSAATPWGMIETIGAVVAARPDIFGAFATHLVNLAGIESTRVSAIWALAEIAGQRPDLIRRAPFYSLLPYLTHSRADVRGQTVRLLGRIKAVEAAVQLMGLHDDEAELTIWEQGHPVHTSVAAQAARALTIIQGNDRP